LVLNELRPRIGALLLSVELWCSDRYKNVYTRGYPASDPAFCAVIRAPLLGESAAVFLGADPSKYGKYLDLKALP
jgi:hypothetical protein